MPLYEYQCLNCGQRTEILQRMDGAPLAACPACGGEVKKLFSAPAVQFKGSGWYVTDYAGKKSEASSKTEKTESKSDDSAKADKPAKEAAAESKSSSGAGSSGSSGSSE